MLHKLYPHLTNPKIPPSYLLVKYHTSDVENLVYLSWQQEDSLLFTWLLTTLSDSILPRIVKCVHAHEIWFVIDQFQQIELYAKSWKLRYELCYIEKGDHTISQYLGRIQKIVGIDSIGDHIFLHDQLETILDGLPSEYQGIASIIKYLNKLCVVIVTKTMLISHEARFKRALCTPVQELLSMNLNLGNTCTTAPTSNSSLSSTLPTTQEAKSQMTTHDTVQHFDGAHGGFRGGIFGGFRGVGCINGGSTCVQCQIRFKIGHVARICYHRHSTQPMPSHLWKNLIAYALCHTPILLLIQ